MIKVILLLAAQQRFPVDGIRDIMRLFYGVAKFIQLSDTELHYEVEEKYTLACGQIENMAFSVCLPKEHVATKDILNLFNEHQQELESKGQIISLDQNETPKVAARKIKRSFYNCLSNITGKKFPWGSLTGIRPTYVANEYLTQAWTREETIRLLESEYRVHPDKATLAVAVALAEQNIIYAQNKNGVHIYIHVPYCRTRCSYCSFTNTDSINPSAQELDAYHRALLFEMHETLSKLTMSVNSIYIGGGTPSIFSAEQLDELLNCLNSYVPLEKVKEISFEAGRSDSVDQEKLELLFGWGITRICVNPQTMRNTTLDRIGRPTTSEDDKATFLMARTVGFENINMDLIAGLSGESVEDFSYSLDEVLKLGPESITVHALARKRKSDLDMLINQYTNKDDACRREDARLLKEALGQANAEVEKMLGLARKKLEAEAYLPYYLYRQKDGVGGLENVGYAKEGFACIYNVCMMNDVQSVIAFGAGAISKKVSELRTLRCPNVNSVNDYCSKASQMVERKLDFFQL